jgi:hypothetical protein
MSDEALEVPAVDPAPVQESGMITCAGIPEIARDVPYCPALDAVTLVHSCRRILAVFGGALVYVSCFIPD